MHRHQMVYLTKKYLNFVTEIERPGEQNVVRLRTVGSVSGLVKASLFKLILN